jgi:hypothetical protein
MREPIEIDVDEHEQSVERVAAIDVAKASGMVCTRVPHDTSEARRVTKVWEVKASTRSLLELADHLVCQGIQRVVIESTSDYWRAFSLHPRCAWPDGVAGQRRTGEERPR